MKRWKSICSVSMAIFVANSANADQFHYNNVIFGERAMGLAGAFTGAADDASGVVYNPAGIAFALSNDISGSANGFYQKRTAYKNTLGGEDFVEQSKGSVAPFFGGLQKLDSLLPGLVMAFGITTVDSDLKDQDDLITGSQVTQLQASGGTLTPGTTNIDRLHRAVNARSSTYLYSLAIAKRLAKNFALGFGMHMRTVDELVQEYQDNQVRAQTANAKGVQIIQNIRDSLNAVYLEPTIGIQWAFATRWSFGLIAKFPVKMSEKLDRSIERTQYSYEPGCVYERASQQGLESGSTCQQAIESGKVASTEKPVDVQTTSYTMRSVVNKADKNPLGSMPTEYRLGVAFFATQRLLWTFDTAYFSDAKKGNEELYKREAIMNFASGLEFYVLPTFPVRFGLFTNNDSRPKLKKHKGTPDAKAADQRDHIDYLGATLFVGWAQPNSQLSIGYINQTGSGEAQKTGGYEVQKVESVSHTVAFSASHNF